MKTTEFLSKLQQLSGEDLQSIKGIGGILTENFKAFLSSKRYTHLIEEFTKLEQAGVNIHIEPTYKRDTATLALSKETICITGSFGQTRDIIKSQLESLGAKVVDTVTSNTTILLAGEKAGSKLEKAQKIGIKIIRDLQEILL